MIDLPRLLAPHRLMANSGKPALVFIVEDNDPDVFLVKEALRLEGVVARIQRCHDGEEAIHVLSQIRETQVPDIIIIDLNLPKVTGRQILKHVRSLKQMDGVPVLILTSSQSRRRSRITGTVQSRASRAAEAVDLGTPANTGAVSHFPAGHQAAPPPLPRRSRES